MQEEQKQAEYQITKTNVLAMLQYRQYSDIQQVNIKALSGYTCKDNNNSPTICFIVPQKISPKDIMTNSKHVIKDYGHIIIVHEHQQAKAIKTHFATIEEGVRLETIHFDQFIFNKPTYFGTDKSTILKPDDVGFQRFMEISGLQMSQLPMKKANDSMMIWLGAQQGDIVLSSKYYESVLRSDIYEYVIDGSDQKETNDDDDD